MHSIHFEKCPGINAYIYSHCLNYYITILHKGISLYSDVKREFTAIKYPNERELVVRYNSTFLAAEHIKVTCESHPAVRENWENEAFTLLSK